MFEISTQIHLKVSKHNTRNYHYLQLLIEFDIDNTK